MDRSNYSNQYSEANEVVQAAKSIKDYGATIFSIGVFGESDGNPLTYADTTQNQSNRQAWKYLGGWMETYQSGGTYYCLRRQWRPNNADGYTAEPNDTIYDYMSVVSSNYPDAKNYIAPAWLTGGFSGNYIAATDGDAVRQKSSAEATNKYYRMASNQDTLIKAFLEATKMNNDESALLSWQAPAYEDFVLPFTEDVESYEAFNVAADLGEWTVVDADGLPTHDDIYAEDVLVEYEGMGQPSSWLVFNPIDRNYPTVAWWGGDNGWNPVSGKQFFASVSVKDGTSDDWLISPELSGEEQTLSFFVHGYTTEHFEVLYSTSGRNTENFTLLASETAPFVWTQHSYDLPEGARYFAIRNVSDVNSYCLFVDDIHFSPASGRGVLQMAENGYNLYRNGELLTTLPASATSYVDHPVRNENLHVVYHVTALYNLGESAADEAEVFFTEGIKDATVRTTAPEGVFFVDGRRLTAPVRGLNIIRQTDGTTRKVFIKH